MGHRQTRLRLRSPKTVLRLAWIRDLHKLNMQIFCASTPFKTSDQKNADRPLPCESLRAIRPHPVFPHTARGTTGFAEPCDVTIFLREADPSTDQRSAATIDFDARKSQTLPIAVVVSACSAYRYLAGSTRCQPKRQPILLPPPILWHPTTPVP